MTHDIFGDMIHRYTRKQALEDGVLVDVSELAKEAGFLYPVAVTYGVWYTWIVPPAEAIGQDEKGRLWDLLNVLRMEIKKGTVKKDRPIDRIDFKVLFHQGQKRVLTDLYALCGPGDEGEPVITVLLPGED